MTFQDLKFANIVSCFDCDVLRDESFFPTERFEICVIEKTFGIGIAANRQMMWNDSYPCL